MNAQGIRRHTLVATLALAGLATTVVDGLLPHTDDGCAVEIHCLACRLVLGGTAVVAAVAAAPAPLESPEAIATPRLGTPAELPQSPTCSRGPPNLLTLRSRG